VAAIPNWDDGIVRYSFEKRRLTNGALGNKVSTLPTRGEGLGRRSPGASLSPSSKELNNGIIKGKVIEIGRTS